jgi:hypothetical protein
MGEEEKEDNGQRTAYPSMFVEGLFGIFFGE